MYMVMLTASFSTECRRTASNTIRPFWSCVAAVSLRYPLVTTASPETVAAVHVEEKSQNA